MVAETCPATVLPRIYGSDLKEIIFRLSHLSGKINANSKYEPETRQPLPKPEAFLGGTCS
jgi:hypothetical protein